MPATSALLACLISAASDFHDNEKLIQKLNRNVSFYLLQWLQRFSGPIENVVNAWKQTFEKAHCLYPMNFIDQQEF
ncbi:hypothetical protein BDQ17DRAFT_1363605 [Cyathus striatus]|nr:hypothetical protein BDQ17DRAFT_1363605 [Cyathus striatus]